MPELTVVIPVYNEEGNLESLLEEILAVVGQNPDEAEILFINDGSTDRTGDLLTELREKCPIVRVVAFEQNAGQSAAMACGFLEARGKYIVSMDGDGQNDPADIPRIIELLKQYQVVCGIRRNRRDTLAKRWGSWFANAIRRCVTGDSIVDIGCSLKGFHRDAVQRLYFFDGIHRFLPVLLQMEGCSITQLEVNHRPRLAGKTKYSNIGRLAKTWQDLLGVRWMQKRKLNYTIRKRC